MFCHVFWSMNSFLQCLWRDVWRWELSPKCSVRLRCEERTLVLESPGLFGPTWWFGHCGNIHMQRFFLIHNVETKNHLALNFKPLPAFPWEWAFLANSKFLNITSPITFSQVSIYAGLAFPIHRAGTGLSLNALQVAGGALGSLAKLVPDGHTVWVITSAH